MLAKRSLFTKLLFGINSIFAFMLLAAYLLPYIPPKTFPLLAVLSLGMPVLIGVNILFLLYWLITFKREFLLPLIVLAIGFNHLLSFYRIDSEAGLSEEADFKIMSYNVHQFNRGNWIKEDSISYKIKDFILKEDPDVIHFQEYDDEVQIAYPEYKYKYVQNKLGNVSQAIYSKYPIVNTASLDFEDTGNNAIYADIVIEKDTIRFLNLHLQSLKIESQLVDLEKADGKNLLKQLARGFRKQQTQVEQINEVVADSPHKMVISGDFNNTPYSYAYKQLSTGFTDAFKVKGRGFGTTFIYDHIPLRIDMVLINPQLQVKGFERYPIGLSDHFPVMAEIGFPAE